ncbi:MAG: CapA family protein, partial [Lachnospiraceae bacterium]|nr:CapA family protein [Lachnospiraceae bacterium]
MTVTIMIAIALGFMIYMLNRPKLIDDYPIAESDAASESSQAEAPEVAEEAEPVEEEPAEPAAPVYEDTTLLFTGDVELSNYVLSNYNASGINGILSEDMLNELVSADLTIINNEFPFSTRGQQAPDKKFTFRVDPKYSVILNEMGVDVA